MGNSYTKTAVAYPEVWVSILHWQGPSYTADCLKSLTRLSYPHIRVLLIDNGSPDSSGLALAKEFAGVECLALAENLGFAGGFNAGIKYCMERGAQWIWLLNNDTKVAPDSLSILISQALNNPKAAVLGATVQYDDIEHQGYYNNSHDGAVSGPGSIDFLRAKTYLRKPKEAASTQCCEWLSGSNLLLRRAALNNEEVFDPDYFLYFEDTEFCVRIRSSGWKCLFVPNARIYHAGNASTSGDLEYWRAYYYTRNRFLFFQKTLGPLKSIPAFVSIFAHLLRHLIVLPFRGSSGRKQLKAEYLGLRDYLLHRLGKADCLEWCKP